VSCRVVACVVASLLFCLQSFLLLFLFVDLEFLLCCVFSMLMMCCYFCCWCVVVVLLLLFGKLGCR